MVESIWTSQSISPAASAWACICCKAWVNTPRSANSSGPVPGSADDTGHGWDLVQQRYQLVTSLRIPPVSDSGAGRDQDVRHGGRGVR